MKSRERFFAALAHKEPDKVPSDLGATLVTGIHRIAYKRLRNYLGLEKKETAEADIWLGLAKVDDDLIEQWELDVAGILPMRDLNRTPKIEEQDGFEQFTDPWGVLRRRKKGGPYFEIASNPLAGMDLEEIKRKDLWPEPKDQVRLDGLIAEGKRLSSEDRPVILGTPGLSIGLLQEFQFLLGFEDAFYSLAADPQLTDYLIGKIADLDIEFWEWALPHLEKHIDIILYPDDFGFQTGPAFSHEMFERFFKNRYRTIFSRIKQISPHLRIMFHTCGSSRFIIGDLIECGVDILNPVQISAAEMGPESLKRDFGKELTFWGAGVDSQKTLPHGSDQQVRDEVKKHVEIMAPGGGFVFSVIHNIQPEVPPENIEAMWSEFQRSR
jgi:uroporphyrinogen decarboxylase